MEIKLIYFGNKIARRGHIFDAFEFIQFRLKLLGIAKRGGQIGGHF